MTSWSTASIMASICASRRLAGAIAAADRRTQPHRRDGLDPRRRAEARGLNFAKPDRTGYFAAIQRRRGRSIDDRESAGSGRRRHRRDHRPTISPRPAMRSRWSTASRAGLETSFANAGEVSPGYASPWAGPGVPVKAIKWLMMKHGPLVIRPKLDPAMWLWLLKLLRNCTSARYAVNKSRMIPLAEYSRDCLRALRAEIGIDMTSAARARCSCSAPRPSSTAPPSDIAVLKQYGVPFEVLDRDGCVGAEPALAASCTKSSAACGCRRTRPATATCSPRRSPFTPKSSASSFRLGTTIEGLDRGRLAGSPASPPAPACCGPMPMSSRSAAGRRGCCGRSAFRCRSIRSRATRSPCRSPIPMARRYRR